MTLDQKWKEFYEENIAEPNPLNYESCESSYFQGALDLKELIINKLEIKIDKQRLDDYGNGMIAGYENALNIIKNLEI